MKKNDGKEKKDASEGKQDQDDVNIMKLFWVSTRFSVSRNKMYICVKG